MTQDVCANVGAGTGVSIPACSPNSNFGGTTASLGWGPSGKLRTATNISACDLNGMTIHWDGDRPLFITDSTGALVQLSVETLGGVFYACQSSGYFIVFDRDFSGTQVSAHDSNGDDGPWEYGQLYSHVIGKGATVQSGGWVGSANAAGDSLVLAPAREDGYAVRGLMIQGVRSYDSNTEQWTTPDAYKGDVHDPMSQRSYMWNNNNPVAYKDPSGYDVIIGISTSPEHEEVIVVNSADPNRSRLLSWGPKQVGGAKSSSLASKEGHLSDSDVGSAEHLMHIAGNTYDWHNVKTTDAQNAAMDSSFHKTATKQFNPVNNNCADAVANGFAAGGSNLGQLLTGMPGLDEKLLGILGVPGGAQNPSNSGSSAPSNGGSHAGPRQ